MEKKMFLKADWQIFDNATLLRKNMTKAEGILWEYLRTKPMNCKFRRQHPIDSYIADFYCHALKLIIEVDGDIHLEKEVADNDKVRQDYLETQGIKFLRFTNSSVENSLSNVIQTIEKYILNIEKPL